MSEKYSALARIYDTLMYDVPYQQWAEYLEKLLQNNGVKSGSRILEYACGTGNLTTLFAQKGYMLTAVDVSEEMLFQAQEKTRKKALSVTYVCADMCEFQLNKPVSAIVCACDGVNYILNKKDLVNFFECAYKNLADDGVFLFDVSSVYKLKHILGDEFYYDDGETETYFWQNHYDNENETVHMDLTLFLSDGSVYERCDETHIQRAWEEKILKDALMQVGFENIEVYGFLTEETSKAEDERIQLVAIKKGNKE